jgi:benzoate-CoA ligase
MAVAEKRAAPAAPDPAPSDAIPRQYNFAADILDRNLAAGRASKTAFFDHRGSWTYGQLADRVERFGHVLRKLGLRREERPSDKVGHGSAIRPKLLVITNH